MTNRTDQMSDWTLPGAGGASIHGTTHLAEGDGEGVVVLVHGFKGYKDYGMFPHLAGAVCRAGWIVHRVSLSHSGMGHGHGPFDEARFEKDTWNRGVEDLQAICGAIDSGVLAGQGAGVVLAGHSRGGSLVLTAAGRHGTDGSLGGVRGVVSLSAPAQLNGLKEEDQARLLKEGRLQSPSARTGQMLHVGRGWLQEQLDDPPGHDLHGLVARIKAPILLVHGTDDEAVPASAAPRIAQAAPGNVQVELLEGANHVFNTPNPFDGESPSQQLRDMEAAVVRFLSGCSRQL
ncbi:MAG: lysophospholipase [Phycisphaerales bacterium]|nr:lysophospholipase [Phycisphaerales bacterium]